MDGYIPEELINKIRGSQDIVEVISRHISLRKSGQNYVGLCPFHQEKTPSFMVSPAKQLFHCFGCGTGGNVITFLMKYESLPFLDAVKSLADDAGIRLTHGNKAEKSEHKTQLYDVNKLAAGYFHDILTKTKEGEPARNYLSGRGLSMDTIESFNIGYVVNSWNSAHEYLREKGIPDDILVKSGVVIPRGSGAGYYDRFRGRIMLPIYDTQNRVAGFGGRVLDDSTPKYLNSPETPVFSKGHILYGLNLAGSYIRESGYAIIVEGYMDVIVVHQAGIQNVVGTLGTALTVNHLNVISRFCKEVILTFDSDVAGVNAALRATDLFLNSDVEAKVLLLPEGEDPDSFTRKHGRASFLELAGEAKGIIDFALERTIGRGVDPKERGSIDKKVQVAGECLNLIKKIPNRIKQDYYLKRVAEEMGIGVEILYTELRRGGKNKGRSPLREKAEDSGVIKPKAEEILLALMMKDGELRRISKDRLSIDDFSDPQFREMAGYLLNSNKDLHDIINDNSCDQAIRGVISRLAVTDLYFDSPERTLFDCIRVLQRNKLDRELKEIEKEITTAETGGTYEKVRGLLLAKQEILQRKKLLYEN